MAQQSTITVTGEEIIAALQQDPRFSDPEALNQVKDLLIQLPEVLGDRLAELVTLKGFLEVEAQFLEFILSTDFDEDFDDMGLTRTLFNQLAAQLASMANDPEAVLAAMGATEPELMLSDQLSLNDEAKELYRAGTMTFADVVRINPGVFLPRNT